MSRHQEKFALAIAEKKLKKAKSKAKPTVEDEEELKEEIHASLTVSIQLKEAAITRVTPKSLEKDAKPGYTGKVRPFSRLA